MSNVSISMDTESKSISVSIDGKVISDVAMISVYKDSYEDEAYLSIDIATSSEEGGSFTKNVRYSSYGSEGFKVDEKVNVEELTKALFQNRGPNPISGV